MENNSGQKEILKGVEAVVFDFDGTLAVLNIDFPAMRDAVRKLATDAGIPGEVLDGLFVLETIETGREWLARKSPDHAASFHRVAMDLISGIEIRASRDGSLFDGVREMLEGMKERKIRRAIITRNCGGRRDHDFFPTYTITARCSCPGNRLGGSNPTRGTSWKH